MPDKPGTVQLTTLGNELETTEAIQQMIRDTLTQLLEKAKSIQSIVIYVDDGEWLRMHQIGRPVELYHLSKQGHELSMKQFQFATDEEPSHGSTPARGH